MKPGQLVLMLFVLTALLSPAFAQPDATSPSGAFFRSMSDVPLMPGLSEIQDDAVVFDKPEGRILEATASAPSRSRDAILSFYDAALPQFGWSRSAAGTFIRQGETLEIGVEDTAGARLVHITILPRS